MLAFRWTGAALACAIMGFPLMVRAMQLSLAAVDRRLEQAAGTLGANPALVFLTVTLPLMAPGIIAGAVLSFARAMGEFGATITFGLQHPGRDADPADVDLYLHASSGRRCRRAAPDADLPRHLALGGILVSEWIARGQQARAERGASRTAEGRSQERERELSSCPALCRASANF